MKCPKCNETKSRNEFYETSLGWCKKCKIQASRDKYAPIKEAVRQRKLSTYRDGKKKCNKCNRWLDTSRYSPHNGHWDNLNHVCKDCVNIKNRANYRKDKEKALAASSDWYYRNKERRQQKDREWRNNNPEKSRAIWHRYKSRKLNADGNFTKDQWNKLKEYYCPDGICIGCREKKKITIDHIVPLIKGGSNHIENIQPICQSCNSSKGDERIIDYRPDKGEFAKELMRESSNAPAP